MEDIFIEIKRLHLLEYTHISTQLTEILDAFFGIFRSHKLYVFIACVTIAVVGFGWGSSIPTFVCNVYNTCVSPRYLKVSGLRSFLHVCVLQHVWPICVFGLVYLTQ